MVDKITRTGTTGKGWLLIPVADDCVGEFEWGDSYT